jgi:uncharacterized protein YjbI with pentapeptide repeats
MIVVHFETGEELELPLECLAGSNLRGLELHRAVFDSLDLIKTDFSGANLRNASFNNSLLNGVVMRGAALMNAALIGAQIKAADLSGVMAVGADFSEADLSMSNLKDSDVGGASFIKANLCGVNFGVRRMDGAFFFEAIFNEETVWPEGFDPIGEAQ